VLHVQSVRTISKQVCLDGAILPTLALTFTPQVDTRLDSDITDIRMDKRAVPSNISFELVPHPVYYNVQTLPMIYPNTTAISNMTLHERNYLWWVLGGAWNVGLAGYGMWQLGEACYSWTKAGTANTEGTTMAACVVGALSTLFMVAGAGIAAANWGATVALSLRLLSAISKRDLSSPDSLQILVDYQTLMVNATGLAMSPMFNELGDLMVHNKSGMPLMFGYNPKGDGMIFTHHNFVGTNTSYMAYGFVPPPSTSSKRDEYYNEEDFTSGGLEAGFSFNQASDGGYLNVENDYGQMDHETSCLFGSLANNDLEFQIFDNNHDGTIAAGNIRAYQSGTFDMNDLKDPVAAPLPEPAACQVA